MCILAVSELEEHEEDVTAAQASSSKMSWINDMKKEAQEKVAVS